jgi:hypothetical protein
MGLLLHLLLVLVTRHHLVVAAMATDDQYRFRPCTHVPGWYECPSDNMSSGNGSVQCVSPSQVCDGRADCLTGDADPWDESAAVCSAVDCGEEGAVRCRRDHVCIAVPHRHVCSSELTQINR